MSRENLKVAIVSNDIAWGDKEENIITVAELLNRVDKDVDLVVLPELFCTGFMPTLGQLHEMAEDDSGVIIVNVQRWAQFFKFAICGSYIAKDNGRYYNRAFFVEPSGDMTFYDKRHLYSITQENKCYEQGLKKSPIIRYRGWNISMQICYDVRFPVWCRNVNNKIDLMVVPANWSTDRAHSWKHLLIARAIENQFFVVGANRSGSDDCGDYNGLSYIFDYLGNNIGFISDKSNLIIHAELDKNAMINNRTDFPTTKDADDFILNIN